jgi:ribonucleoside-diphosphate reductase alpha chain
MNFSFIRPRGSFIHGIGVETPGAVKYMELFNTSSDVITAGAGKKKKSNHEGKTKIRKGAMMGVLDVWHPDIEEFITAKMQENRLNKFNLSVNCSNEFMERVAAICERRKILESNQPDFDTLFPKIEAELKELENWNLIFPDTKHPQYKKEWDGNIQAWKAKGYAVKVVKTVKTLELWDLIMQSTYNRNDPGVLFLDRANETHCYYYGGRKTWIASTNPCGEQCLPFGFVCNLASMNLTQFVTNKGIFDFDKFDKYIPWAVRLLDNVNDYTAAPLPEYAASIKEARRIGLGVMGWGSLLYMMRIRFGSPEAEQLKERIMSKLTTTAIQASINLAREKGMFAGCRPAAHADAPYFKKIGLCQTLLDQIKKYGIRNSALFSCQPTGNTGVFANVVSGGIEPVFLSEYIRTVIVDGCPADMLDIVPKYWEGEFKETDTFKWTQEGNDKILRGTHKGIVYKIDRNRGLTKEVPCVDYGVRWLKERDLWDAKAKWAVTSSSLTVQEHLTDMKGFAKWIDSSISKTVNLPNDYPYEDFKTLYLDAFKSGVLKGITTYRAGTMMNVLAANKCVISTTAAPKRPQDMAGELHHFVIDGRKYYVAVGLFGDENQPYEVFTGVNETRKEIYIPKTVKTGVIKKQGRGNYHFVHEGEVYELTNGHSNDTAAALTRIISTALRHGTDIAFIVHQLEKTEGPITCFSKALARTLKKYIKDGTSISGEECPECKGKMVRKEGCASCPQCGHSKCG